MASKLQLHAFSRHGFDRERARAFLDAVAKTPFAPDAFGDAEPIRKRLTRDTRDEAEEMLAGEPAYGGALFLASKKRGTTLVVRWAPGTIAPWYGELENAKVEQLPEALAPLFRAAPVVFAALASAEDFRAKHWVVEDDEDGGETLTKRGLDLERCLPGVYWTTVFGPELVRHFGRAALLAAPKARAIDLGTAGMALVLETDPFRSKRATRAAAEHAIVRALGEEAFFEPSEPDRPCRPIPGVIAAEPRRGR